MSDELLREQVDYYRRRAREYDATAYGDLEAAAERIRRLVAGWGVRGDVLEIACGTGLWTEALAGWGSTVTAIDAAPEAVEIARGRVRAANVSFEIADIFTWMPMRRFDIIFFGFWLSHVPASRFEQFWRLLRGLLAEHGRALFVDEHAGTRRKEAYVAGSDEIVKRWLSDGSEHRLVKVFVDPHRLTDRLRELGWEVYIRGEGSNWVVGEAHPV